MNRRTGIGHASHFVSAVDLVIGANVDGSIRGDRTAPIDGNSEVLIQGSSQRVVQGRAEPLMAPDRRMTSIYVLTSIGALLTVVLGCGPAGALPSGVAPPPEAPDRALAERRDPPVEISAWRAVLEDVSGDELEQLVRVFPDLIELELRGGTVDLRHVARLEHLERLTMTDTYVVEFDGIAGATSLRELSVELPETLGYPHLTPLASLTSLAGLASLRRLTRLRIVAPQDRLFDLIETLPELPNLSALALEAQGAAETLDDVPTLARLAALPRLRELEIDARGTFLKLDGIEETHVETLVLRNAAANLEPLTRRPDRLRDLTLDGYTGAPPEYVPVWRWLLMGVTVDLSVLAKLTDLESLTLARLAVSDLAFLRGLVKLERLGLSAAAVGDVSELRRNATCEVDLRGVRRLVFGPPVVAENARFLRELESVVSRRSCPSRCEGRCEVRFNWWRGVR